MLYKLRQFEVITASLFPLPYIARSVSWVAHKVSTVGIFLTTDQIIEEAVIILCDVNYTFSKDF